MMIYEVNMVVEASRYDQLCSWLGDHVEEVLAYAQFLDAETYEMESEEGRRGVSIHYFVAKPNTLERYLIEHAPRLRIKAQSELPFLLQMNQRVLTPVEL